MFEADNIRDWRDHDVVDPDGNQIGQLTAVYVNMANDVPVFASVKTGMIGRHRLTIVPLDRATVAPSHVRVAYSKKQVKGAFEIDTDGELAAEEEPGPVRALRPGLPARVPAASAVWPGAKAGRDHLMAFPAAHHRGHGPGHHRRCREGPAVPADHRRGGALGRLHLPRRLPARTRTPPGPVRQ